MTSTPVVLILGSGPRVGASVAKYFAENDYKVAIASRKCSNDTDINGVFSLQADLSKLESIPALFRAVKDHFQADPSVVVYNAAALTPPPDQSSMFSISPTSITNDLRVNTISAYVAAQEAVKAWDATPNDTKKTFIYTGNMQNVAVVPVVMMMNLGIGKSASASWIGLADINYAQKGYRFFYADERHEDGKLKGMALDGAAHGEFYTQLAKHEGNVPWQATFVKNKGYVSFK